jgi:phosphoribosyl-dephospho-CoA transferase
MPDARQTCSPPWRRHDLLHVRPDLWATSLARCSTAERVPLVERWADQGWPVIVRRRIEAEDARLVPVGLPLPPSAGKCRVALQIPPGDVSQRSSPPPLETAASVSKPEWRSTIAALLGLGARTGVEPWVFGSLLWQYQTGLTYLSPSSDLDVLWPIPAGSDVLSLVFGIADVQRDAPVRIDGEVMFSNGNAVNWRELLNAHQSPDCITVLVKTMNGVRILDVTSLLRVEKQT